MSQLNVDEGIFLNSDQVGLLSLQEERLTKLIKKEPISNVYHVEHTPFARGKFATVRKCTHRDTGVHYAAKFIRKRRRSMDQRSDIVHEVAVLQAAAGSTRIVSLHEVYETPAEMALVLELAAGGELQRVLDMQDGLEEGQAVRLLLQILEGLSFLHERNIAHLDLKPQNLLLTAEYPDCDVKLCDFGISRVIQAGVEVREIIGTPDYVAPEILSYEPISLATDIWSVGVLTYVLLSGFSPFGGESKQETFCNISQCKLSFPDELFENVSDQAKDFICATLHTDPRLRLTVGECLSHPWLSGSCPGPCQSLSLAQEATVAENRTSNVHLTNGTSRTSTEVNDTDVHLPNGTSKTSTTELNGTDIHLTSGSSECRLPNGELNSLETNRTSNDYFKIDTNDTTTGSIDVKKLCRRNSTETSSCTSFTVDAISNGNSLGSLDEDEDPDLPVQKRPKNCLTGRRASFPVPSCFSCGQCDKQCCHSPHSPPHNNQHQLAASQAEITLYRGIIC